MKSGTVALKSSRKSQIDEIGFLDGVDLAARAHDAQQVEAEAVGKCACMVVRWDHAGLSSTRLLSAGIIA